jgi:serine/threonine-protein kinase
MLGTPYYMSPEQAQGIRAIDFRTDLWSMAVIVFQGLTGKLPFDSEALGDLIVKIVTAQPPMPSEVGCTLPGIDQWWARAIARDPAQRFQSAREFADTLAVVCGVTFTGRESRPQLPSAPSFPLDGTSGGALATTPSPMAATVTGLPKKSAAPLIAGGVVALLVLGGAGVYALTSKPAPPAAVSPPPEPSSTVAAAPSSPPVAPSAAVPAETAAPAPPPTTAAAEPPPPSATAPAAGPAKAPPAPASPGSPGSTKKPGTHDKPPSPSKPPEFGF